MSVDVIMKASRVYKLMLERCYSPRATGYQNYGGRGIYVDESWIVNPTSFFDWYKANYFDGCQVNRINNNGPYSEKNCQLVTAVENNRNRRNTKRYEAFGESKNLAEWAEDPRCQEKNWRNIDRRIRNGASLEDAMRSDYSKVRYDKSSKSQQAAAPQIKAFGESKSLAGWASDQRCVVSKGTLWYRIKNGWDSEHAITKPSKTKSML